MEGSARCTRREFTFHGGKDALDEGAQGIEWGGKMLTHLKAHTGGPATGAALGRYYAVGFELLAAEGAVCETARRSGDRADADHGGDADGAAGVQAGRAGDPAGRRAGYGAGHAAGRATRSSRRRARRSQPSRTRSRTAKQGIGRRGESAGQISRPPRRGPRQPQGFTRHDRDDEAKERYAGVAGERVRGLRRHGRESRC